MLAWQKRTVLISACLLLTACSLVRRIQGKPTAQLDPAPAGATGTLVRNDERGTLAHDPVRDELREILMPCQRRLGQMRDERFDEQRRERVLTVIAFILSSYYQSEHAGDQDPPSGAECTGGTLDRSCAFASEREFGFRFGGSDEDVTGPQVLPTRAVDGAIEAVDSVLWASPDSRDWDTEQHEIYESRRNNLARLCEQLRRAEAE